MPQSIWQPLQYKEFEDIIDTLLSNTVQGSQGNDNVVRSINNLKINMTDYMYKIVTPSITAGHYNKNTSNERIQMHIVLIRYLMKQYMDFLTIMYNPNHYVTLVKNIQIAYKINTEGRDITELEKQDLLELLTSKALRFIDGCIYPYPPLAPKKPQDGGRRRKNTKAK